MTFRRKKNNKARKILRKIRSRKAFSFKKAVRAICKKTILRKAETKYKAEDVVSNTLTCTSSAIIYRQVYDVLPNCVEGTDSFNREGLSIEKVNCTQQFRVEVLSGELSTVNIKIYCRAIWYMPKLNQDDLDCLAYLNSLFNGVTSSTQIGCYLDPHRLHVLKDTGVRILGGSGNSNIRPWLKFNFSWRRSGHLDYTEAGDLQPTDRNPKLYLAYQATVNGTNFITFNVRKMTFKDI